LKSFYNFEKVYGKTTSKNIQNIVYKKG